jgi:hypothetical protein
MNHGWRLASQSAAGFFKSTENYRLPADGDLLTAAGVLA